MLVQFGYYSCRLSRQTKNASGLLDPFGQHVCRLSPETKNATGELDQGQYGQHCCRPLNSTTLHACELLHQVQYGRHACRRLSHSMHLTFLMTGSTDNMAADSVQRPRLPHGIASIRKHIKEADDVPLRVRISLYARSVGSIRNHTMEAEYVPLMVCLYASSVEWI